MLGLSWTFRRPPWRDQLHCPWEVETWIAPSAEFYETPAIRAECRDSFTTQHRSLLLVQRTKRGSDVGEESTKRANPENAIPVEGKRPH